MRVYFGEGYYWCRHLKDDQWRVVLIAKDDGNLKVWSFLQPNPINLEDLETSEYEWIELDFPED